MLDIINKRSIPGVLIVDADYNLLYANSQALEIIFGHTGLRTRDERNRPVPDEVTTLCEGLKSDPVVSSFHCNVHGCEILDARTGGLCSIRVFFIGNPAASKELQHIMVLIESIIEKHEMDFVKVKREYGLSKREVEVLQCVCRGLTNKEIAQTNFISEYTVKNHVRKIMRRMGVNSRSEIFVALR